MDPEKNQLSENSSPPAAFFRRERNKGFLQALSYAAVIVLLLLGIHRLELIAGFNSSLPRTEGHGYRHHRLTVKEREKLFLYVRRPL